jgi:hypothetical protein
MIGAASAGGLVTPTPHSARAVAPARRPRRAATRLIKEMWNGERSGLGEPEEQAPVLRPRDGWPQSRNCACLRAAMSFRAMESAATIPHAHGEHCADEGWADVEGG